MITKFESRIDRDIRKKTSESDACSQELQSKLAQYEMKVNNGGKVTEDDVNSLLSSLAKRVRLSNEEHKLLEEKSGKDLGPNTIGECLAEFAPKSNLRIL